MASIMGYPHHQDSNGNGIYSDTGRKGAHLVWCWGNEQDRIPDQLPNGCGKETAVSKIRSINPEARQVRS